jgi:hypothetical protein
MVEGDGDSEDFDGDSIHLELDMGLPTTILKRTSTCHRGKMMLRGGFY